MDGWRKDAPKVALSRFADTVGDGSGTSNAIGVYAANTDFMIKPGALEVFDITRLILSIEDAGNFAAAGYGAVTSPLTNGIIIGVKDDTGDLWEWTDDPIHSNSEWAHYCHDLTVHAFGVGNNHMTARWTFAKSGHPLVLNGAKGTTLYIRLKDDFSALLQHRFLIQGTKREGF